MYLLCLLICKIMNNYKKVVNFILFRYINITLFITLETKEEEGPKRPAGLKRKEELELLYGGTSSLIHKLETAAQLNFNRNCDTFKPELWMAAPLNQETLAE